MDPLHNRSDPYALQKMMEINAHIESPKHTSSRQDSDEEGEIYKCAENEDPLPLENFSDARLNFEKVKATTIGTSNSFALATACSQKSFMNQEPVIDSDNETPSYIPEEEPIPRIYTNDH